MKFNITFKFIYHLQLMLDTTSTTLIYFILDNF